MCKDDDEDDGDDWWGKDVARSLHERVTERPTRPIPAQNKFKLYSSLPLSTDPIAQEATSGTQEGCMCMCENVNVCVCVCVKM